MDEEEQINDRLESMVPTNCVAAGVTCNEASTDPTCNEEVKNSVNQQLIQRNNIVQSPYVNSPFQNCQNNGSDNSLVMAQTMFEV